MASQGPLSPASGAGDGSDVAWSNVSNALSSNDSYATATLLITDSQTEYLAFSQFGFSIPAGSTINGIQVDIEAKQASGAEFGQIGGVAVTKDGVVSSATSFDGTVLGTSDAYESFGGATELWGETYTVAQVNASSFGVLFAGLNNGVAAVLSLDHVRMTVYYTAPSGVRRTAGPSIGGAQIY